jgi:hypothetical protein
MFMTSIHRFFLFLLFICCLPGACIRDQKKDIYREDDNGDPSVMAALDISTVPFGIDELLPGDIIVRANNNWLPGSAFVPGGYTFGHAAVVIRGARHADTDSLLRQALVWESIARDVAPEYQVRLVPAYVVDPDPNRSNGSFGPAYQGIRYRLRIPLTTTERDSLVAFLLRQDHCTSSWRALKDYSEPSSGCAWYCTLMIWKAFNRLKGIDPDANGGLVIYPNDLIADTSFDNRPGELRRIRF